MIAKALLNTLKSNMKTVSSVKPDSCATTTTKTEKDEHPAPTPDTSTTLGELEPQKEPEVTTTTTTTKTEKDEHPAPTPDTSTTCGELEPQQEPEMDANAHADQVHPQLEPTAEKDKQIDVETHAGLVTDTDTNNDITVEKTLYTHALGHKCDRKHCNPIIITKHGIVKPNKPSTSHSHLSGSCDKGGQKIKPKQELIEETIKMETHLDKDPTTIIPQTEAPDHEKDEQPNIDDVGLNQTTTQTTTTEHETDEQRLQAADGLLMLRELASLDTIEPTTANKNASLMPINVPGTQDTKNIAAETRDNGDKDENDDNNDGNTNSDDTIIYDTTNPELELQADLDKDTQNNDNSTKETEPQKKGPLIIREIGLRRGGTQTENKEEEYYIRPAISTSGKVCCDFCRREFNTLTEQCQHMA